MKLVPQQFFPNSDRPELVVELRLKEGSSFAATTEQVKKMEAVLAKDEEVKFYTAYTGAGQARFYLALDPELPNAGYAVFVVMTKGLDARERVRSRLMATGNEQFPNVWVRITRLELGPPVGFPVQFRVVGPDTQKVREIARRATRLERPRSHATSRHRSGQGSRTRSRAGRRVIRDANGDEWRDVVAVARARGAGRHRRARR